MPRKTKNTIFILILAGITNINARQFSFVQISDTHIRQNSQAIEDLYRSVELINSMDSVKFVILSGDVTHNGDRESMLTTMSLLDYIHVPYYAIPGNHETKWGTQAVNDFRDIFGNDKFVFEYEDCVFVGINTGDTVMPSEGHVSNSELQWLDATLAKYPEKIKFVVTHHPLQEGDVDNWAEVTYILNKYDVTCILSGHYHRNLLFDCDGIPCVLTRSNKRGEQQLSGFSVITITDKNITWQEVDSNGNTETWLTLPLSNE